MSTSSRKDNDMESKIKRLLEQIKSGESSKMLAATMQLAALKKEAKGDVGALKRLADIEQDFKAGKLVAEPLSPPSNTVTDVSHSSASTSARSSASKNSEASHLSDSEQEELAELQASVTGIINMILEKQKLLKKYLKEFDHDKLNDSLGLLKVELSKVSSTHEFEGVYNRFKQQIDDSWGSPHALLTHLNQLKGTLDTVNDPEGQTLAKLEDQIREGIRSTDEDIQDLKSYEPMNDAEQSLADSMLGKAGDNAIMDKAIIAKLSEVHNVIGNYVKNLDDFIKYKKKDNDYSKDARYLIAVQLCDNLLKVKGDLEKGGSVGAKVTGLEKVDSYFTEAIKGATKAKGDEETGPAKPLERGFKSKFAKLFSGAPSLIDILADYQKTGCHKVDAGLTDIKKMIPKNQM